MIFPRFPLPSDNYFRNTRNRFSVLWSSTPGCPGFTTVPDLRLEDLFH